MTLNDLELLYGQIIVEFRDISRISEAIMIIFYSLRSDSNNIVIKKEIKSK